MGLKDLFFSVEKTEDAPVDAKQPQKGATTTVATPTTNLPLPAVITAGVNQEMMDILNKAVSDANLEGFDYLEFREALAGYADMPMTEQQKYEAVYRTVKVIGVSADKLIASIDHYVNVVSAQRDGFLANVENAVKEQVDAKNADIVASEQKIAKAIEDINKLNELVVKTQQEVLAMKNEVAQNQQQIDNTRASFEATYNVVVGRLNEDKTKMTTFLNK